MYPNIKWHEQNPCSPLAPTGEIWFSTSLLPALQRQMVVSWCPLLVLDTRTVQGVNLYPRAAGPPTLSPLEDGCPWGWAGSSCSLCPVSGCLASTPAARPMTWCGTEQANGLLLPLTFLSLCACVHNQKFGTRWSLPSLPKSPKWENLHITAWMGARRI